MQVPVSHEAARVRRTIVEIPAAPWLGCTISPGVSIRLISVSILGVSQPLCPERHANVRTQDT